MRSFFITAAVLAFAAAANAQEVAPVETAAVETSTPRPVQTVPPSFFATICNLNSEGRVTLSENAVTACNGGKMPRIAQDSSRFFNTGAGAEFNALAANIERF